MSPLDNQPRLWHWGQQYSMPVHITSASCQPWLSAHVSHAVWYQINRHISWSCTDNHDKLSNAKYIFNVYTSRLSVKALCDKLLVSCQTHCGIYLRTEWRPKHASDFRPTCPPGQTLHTCRLVPTVSSICKCRCLPVAKRANRAFSSTLIRQMALAYEVAFALCGHWSLQNPG